MPILLTTPFNGGDSEVGPLTHVMIQEVHISLMGAHIGLIVHRGTYDGSAFTKAQHMAQDVTMFTPVINGQDFEDLVQLMGDSSKTVYDSVAEGLYQWLLDNGLFSGTIV